MIAAFCLRAKGAYLAEKRDALERLAKMADGIVNPPDASNVVALHG